MNKVKNWKICSLGNICKISSGGTPSRRIRQYFQGNIPWVKSGELNDACIYESEECISEDAVNNSSAKIFPKGSLLIALYGATIGKMAFLGIPAATNQAICCFFANSIINLHFLFYFLLFNRHSLIFSAKGGAQKNISQDMLKNLQVPVPPLAEQKRIVKKIEELFAVIDKNIQKLEHTQQALIQYRQSVLQQAFSGKLYKTTNWDNYFFSDLCAYIQRGKSPKYTEQSSLPVINQKCIRWNELQTQHLKFIAPIQFKSWTKERHVQPMDILWNSTGTGTIGRAYLYKGKELSDAVVDSHVTILRANPVKVLPHFLFLYIQSPFVQQKIEKMQSGSTNQVELARKEIQNISISLPSLPEQKAIVQKIEKAFACVDKTQAAISAALEQAKQLKQSILKRAFEGRLVPQDPNDKPVDLTQLTPKGKTK